MGILTSQVCTFSCDTPIPLQVTVQGFRGTSEIANRDSAPDGGDAPAEVRVPYGPFRALLTPTRASNSLMLETYSPYM